MKPIDLVISPGWRVLTAAVAILMSVLAIIGTSRLGIDDQYNQLFRADNEEFRTFQELSRDFNTGENDLIFLLESGDMLDDACLEVVRQLHQELQNVSGVESVHSIHSARRSRRVGRYFLPLFPYSDAEGSENRSDDAKLEAMNHPLISNRMLSADRTATLVCVRLKSDETSLDTASARLNAVREVANEVTTGSSISFGITGLPAIRVETIRSLQRDNLYISAIAVICATLVAWLLMRRLRYVVALITPPALGVLWSLGLMGWFGKNLDAICIILPALWMVIAVADSMHLMVHIVEERTAGLSANNAVRSAIDQLGRASLLTSFTTAIGFFSSIACSDQIIREFGWWAAIGVCTCYVAVRIGVPWLGATGLSRPAPQVHDTSNTSHYASHWRGSFWRWLAWPRKWHVAGAIGFGTLTILLLLCSMKLEPNYRFSENLTASSESKRTLESCHTKFGGLPLAHILVEWPEGQKLSSPQLLAVLKSVHDAIDENSMIKFPTSFLSLLQSLPGEATDLHDRFHELKYLPAEFLVGIIRGDIRRTLIVALAPDIGSSLLKEPLASLTHKFRDIEINNPGFSVRLTGFIPISTTRANSMIRDLQVSLLSEAIIIWLAIVLTFRSLKFGMVSMVPNALPLVATGAFMVWAGYNLQYASVLTFGISLGIAVDDTIHILNRVQLETRRGLSERAAIEVTMRTMSPVLITTSILLLIGFGSTIFSSVPTIRAFGIFTCITLALGLLCDFVVTPCIYTACIRAGSS